MTYWRLFYHVVWSTHRREPWLDADRAGLVERAIRKRLQDMGVLVHGMAVMPDHVHAAMSISPDDRVAWVVQQMKGSSSFLLQHEDSSSAAEGFMWQREYGVLSFSERNLPTVLDYIANQQAHHANGTVSRGMEPAGDTPGRPHSGRAAGRPGTLRPDVPTPTSSVPEASRATSDSS